MNHLTGTKLGIFCEHVLEAGWLVALLLIPLFSNPTSMQRFTPDKAILVRIIATVMALAWIVGVLERQGRGQGSRGAGEQGSKGAREQGSGGARDGASILVRLYTQTPLLLPALAVLASTLLSTVTSVAPLVSLVGSHERFQGLLTLAAYLIIFSAVLTRLRSRAQVQRLLTVVALGSIPVVLWGLAQRAGYDDLLVGRSRLEAMARPFSSLGNPNSLGAYLIMALPLTLAAGLLAPIHPLSPVPPGQAGKVSGLAWQEWRRRPERRWAAGLALGVYGLVAALQLLCLLFTQSRAAWLGFGAGTGLTVLAWAALRRRQRLALGAVGGLVTVAGFLLLLNLTGGPLASLQRLPYLDRLSVILAPQETGAQRTIIWQGTWRMVIADPWRLLVGYGPDTMKLAYAPYYPPQLAHFEAGFRRAVPDRAHNEVLDTLAATGLVGLATWGWLLAAALGRALCGLGLLTGRRQVAALAGLMVGGSLLSAAVAWTWAGGSTWLALALPLGLLASLGLYLACLAFRGRTARPVTASPATILLLALCFALVAYFVEVQFSFLIVETGLYLWVVLGMLGALAAVRWEEPPAERVPTEGNERRRGQRARQQVAPARRVEPPGWTTQLQPTWSAVALGLLLVTLSLGLIVPGTLALPLLLLATWLLGVLLALAVGGGVRQDDGGLAPIYPDSKVSGLAGWQTLPLWSAGLLLTFLPLYQANMQPDGSVGAYSVYLVFVLLGLAGLAAVLAWDDLACAPLRWRRGLPALLLTLAAAIVIALIGLRPMAAEILSRERASLAAAGQLDVSLDRAKWAVSLAPERDIYYAWLAEALALKGRATAEAARRDAFFEQARQALEQGNRLNPFNPDQLSSLGLLHQTWALLTAQGPLREARFAQAEGYFRQAATLHSSSVHLLNDWALLYQAWGRTDEALTKLEEARRLDPEFMKTYILLGDLYQARGEPEKELAALRQGLAANPYSMDGHVALAYAYYHQGMLEEAVRENLTAAQLDTLEFTPHKNLSVIYEERGRVAEALAEARRARELASPQEWAALDAFIARLQGPQKK